MNRQLLWGTTVILLAASPLIPGWGQNPSDLKEERHDFSKLTDEQFAAKAAQINLAEITLGTHAQQKAKRSQVQEFGRQMVQDHTNASSQLQTASLKKRYALPTKLDASHQANVDKLIALQGDEFDRAYIQEMTKGHNMAAQLYEHESRNGNDADLKSYAAAVLPTVRQHEQKARQIWKDFFDANR